MNQAIDMSGNHEMVKAHLTTNSLQHAVKAL